MKKLQLILLFTLLSCRQASNSGLQEVLYAGGEEGFVVGPVWDLNTAWSVGYSDSLLEVCQPEKPEMVKYLTLKAKVDANKNAYSLTICRYSNNIIELLHNIEGIAKQPDQNQVEGLCYAMQYRGSNKGKIDEGLGKADIYGIERIVEIDYKRQSDALVSKAEEVFDFIENGKERTQAISITKKLGKDLQPIFAAATEASREYNDYVQQLIAAGTTQFECPAIAVINGDTLLDNMPPGSQKELIDKTVGMLQGLDAVNRPYGNPDDQMIPFAKPPLNTFTYVISKEDVVYKAIKASLTNNASDVASSQDYQVARNIIDRSKALQEISTAFYNNIRLLDPDTSKDLDTNRLHELFARFDLSGEETQSELKRLSEMVNNLPNSTRWQFEDNPFGALSHVQIKATWLYFIECNKSENGCKNKPEYRNRVEVESAQKTVKTIIERRQNELQRLYDARSRAIKSQLQFPED